MIVEIRPTQYRVDFEHPEDRSNIGEIDYRTDIILIAPDMPDQAKKHVLCHEIAHAMLQRLSGRDMESDANTLGDTLLMFIQDNKDVIKYMQALEKMKWR